MRFRHLAATVLTGLALSLAAPAAGHADDGGRLVNVDGSQVGAVTVPGENLVNAGSGSWDGDASGSLVSGRED